MILTVRICTETRIGDSEYISAALGVLWEIAKCNFATCGAVLVSSPSTWKKIAGFGVIVLVLVLMSGSIAASLMYLDGSRDMRHEARAIEIRTRDELQQRIAAIDRDISMREGIVSGYLAGEYRQRANNASHEIEAIRQQRSGLARELVSSETRLLQMPLETFEGLAFSLGGDIKLSDKIRLIAGMFIAIVLELIGIVSLMLATIRWRQVHVTIPQAAIVPMVVDTQKVQDTDTDDEPDEVHPSAVVFGIMDRLGAAKDAVRTGTIKPTVRAIKSLKLGQVTSQRVLSELVADGTLVKKGRRFVVAKEVVNG